MSMMGWDVGGDREGEEGEGEGERRRRDSEGRAARRDLEDLPIAVLVERERGRDVLRLATQRHMQVQRQGEARTQPLASRMPHMDTDTDIIECVPLCVPFRFPLI